MSKTSPRRMLLESHLKSLRLPTFLDNYGKVGEDAAKASLPYDRYLLALTEPEIQTRERNRIARCIKTARFPVMKELADFDFSAIPSLNKQQILEMSQGQYIERHEPIMMVGNPGLGKSHIATALALAACRQGRKVRFYNVAGLVNDLTVAQDEHRLPKLITASLKHDLIVLDELGLIPFPPRETAAPQLQTVSMGQGRAPPDSTEWRFPDPQRRGTIPHGCLATRPHQYFPQWPD